ncbi:hypothetical protein VME0621_05132 [Vibrio mediterranei]|nr:hypothetical protein VME0621_05132 [Vibrio mediterranei]
MIFLLHELVTAIWFLLGGMIALATIHGLKGG